MMQELCTKLGLGTLLGDPRPLSGGLMHRMAALDTEKGLFAVKALNPSVMARPEALGNFQRALAWERLLEEAGLPIAAAIPFHGEKLVEFRGCYYLFFPYCPGKAVTAKDATVAQIETVARILSQIHALPCPQERPEAFTHPPIPWESYAGALNAVAPELGQLYRDLLPELLCWQKEAEVISYTPERLVLCHNDMDPKNILWLDDAPTVIDLECLGLSDPATEVWDLALLWAGLEEECFDTARFTRFLHAYREAGGHLPEDPTPLYVTRTGPFFWLRFNLERVLGRTGEEDVQALGLAESLKTLRQLQRYFRMQEELAALWPKS